MQHSPTRQRPTRHWMEQFTTIFQKHHRGIARQGGLFVDALGERQKVYNDKTNTAYRLLVYIVENSAEHGARFTVAVQHCKSQRIPSLYGPKIDVFGPHSIGSVQRYLTDEYPHINHQKWLPLREN